MQIPEELVSAVAQRRAILFAGAGLSCSLGLPLFNVLTDRLSRELNIQASEIDYPVLAEYYFLKTKRTEQLYAWMRQTWPPSQVDIYQSDAHSAIVKLDFPVIYTTNYDSWIERAFAAHGKPFRKVIRVGDLAATQQGETEIIKFHGDLEDPESIILTESSFLRRMSLEEPLDIRLRSDSLARPLLFVGYSLSDPNIRFLLFRLRELWSRHNQGGERPKSYILIVHRDELQERLLCERGVYPIVAEHHDATDGLRAFFSALVDQVQDQTGNHLRPQAVFTG